MSIAKEVFFINLGKKIARVLGAAVSVLLMLLCVLLIISAVAFGAGGTVGVFGYNLYICESSDYEGVEQGSAVIVERREPYNLEDGDLVMYSVPGIDGGDSSVALGYAGEVTMSDGVYSIEISVGENSTVITESALIGAAVWSSPAFGAFISFSLTPVGVCVMAILPCAALVLYDIIRAAAANRPLPEVVPQLKNDKAKDKQPSGLSVEPDGNAAYSRSSGKRSANDADSVLFTYNGRQRGSKPAAPSGQGSRGVLPYPLNDKPSSGSGLPYPLNDKPKTASGGGVPYSLSDKPKAAPVNETPSALRDRPAPASEPEPAAPPEPAKIPASVAAKRYVDSAVNGEPRSAVNTATAEMPAAQKTKKPDAFFAQSEAPQIGRKGIVPGAAGRSAVNLDDALASAGERRQSGRAADRRRTDTGSGRKSAEILASKRRDELIADDDDSRDKNRYDVDDILAGLERRNRQ